MESVSFVYAAAVIALLARMKAVCQSLTQYWIMSSIITAVFKATIGLLVNKGRDKAAEKLKDGDVTDQKFRGLIVREIDDIKLKLDGLARKDLLASISFFEEGIELLYVVFDKARSINENDRKAAQLPAEAACAEAVSLAEGMRNLKLTGLDESATRALSNAKKRFKDARREATKAFKNEASGTSDRILAMQYRVMATVLETVDNPVDAVPPCRVCIKELNSLSAVQNSFDVHLKKGIQAVNGLFSKDERRKIVCNVCHVNRVIYDVTQAVGKEEPFWMWPAVDTGEGKLDPLRDERITEVLLKQDMEHCCVIPWSLDLECDGGQKLKKPVAIATNSRGQFIVADLRDRNVKVFDTKGNFVDLFMIFPPSDGKSQVLSIFDVASGMNDNFYVAVKLYSPKTGISKFVVYKFNYTACHHHKFPLRERNYYDMLAMTVGCSGKIFVVARSLAGDDRIDVYGPDGQLFCSFGEGLFKDASGITAANNGRVMVVDGYDYHVHIFSEHGDHLFKFKLEGCYYYPRIAFHHASEHLVVADVESRKNRLHVQIYTKDGEFVRSTQINVEGIYRDIPLRGVAVTIEGHIATVLKVSNYNTFKVLVL